MISVLRVRVCGWGRVEKTSLAGLFELNCEVLAPLHWGDLA